MSKAKAINEQLHKLLYQHETGSVDKSQYRQLRARLIDGFAVTHSNIHEAPKQQNDANTPSKNTEGSSAFALFLTVLLVLAATLLLVYTYTTSTIEPPQAQTTPTVLVDEK